MGASVQCVRPGAGRRAARRGFSLVELLVVIAIIALVIAIILPALGAVRTLTRKTQTQTLIKAFGDAVGQFQRDNERLPGVYSVEEMGSPENASKYGMSAMENAMLELAGGVVTVGGAGGVQANGQTQVVFGPTQAAVQANNAASRRVDITRIGVSTPENPAYFTIDPKYYVPQEEGQQFGEEGHTAQNGSDPSIPDLVDAFGNPLLLWVANSNTVLIEDVDDFAAIDSGTNGATQAMYYWASNAAFLKVDQLGPERRNQLSQGGSDRQYSLIADAGGGLSATDVRDSLAGMLGSPSYPAEAALAATTQNANDYYPLQGRGTFFVQSAGADGYYLGAGDAGTRRVGGKPIRYAWNFLVPGGTARHTENGAPTTIDLLDFFDDITAQGGN